MKTHSCMYFSENIRARLCDIIDTSEKEPEKTGNIPNCTHRALEGVIGAGSAITGILMINEIRFRYLWEFE